MIIDNAVFLITGGTGSFGHAMVRRLMRTKVAEIRIFSRDEKKQDDMRKEFSDERIRFYLGDVRDSGAVDSAMTDVDFMFHAAALKQVPSCEFFPLEAVKTNILGTSNVLDSAIKNRVSRAVILSTDKAVAPVNAMGMSKALMEKVVVAKAREIKGRSKTLLCCTRYGNVIASRGSVVPLFFEQIRLGKPLTVTNGAMTRFMLTLEDAIELVLYAIEHTKGGEIFVKKAPGASVSQVVNSVKKMVDLPEYPVESIGVRDAEKLHEVLVSVDEMRQAIDTDDFYVIPPDSKDLDYERYFSGQKSQTDSRSGFLEYTSDNTNQLLDDELLDIFVNDPSIVELKKTCLGGKL
jgi:UDP-N-acetylglucosamine 4,6-dehydratase/5-epimerase